MDTGDCRRPDVSLVLWDLHGEDDFQTVNMTYFRGASGYLLVADGTRLATLERAIVLQKSVEQAVGKLPFVFILNKADLTEEWEVGEDMIAKLAGKGWTVLKGSAKTGQGVEEAFSLLTDKILPVGPSPALTGSYTQRHK